MNKFKLLLGLPVVILLAACSRTEQGEVNEGPAAQEEASAVIATNCPKADDRGIIEVQDGLTATITKKGTSCTAMLMMNGTAMADSSSGATMAIGPNWVLNCVASMIARAIAA